MSNNKKLIYEVVVKEIRPYVDERGMVAEIVRADDPVYHGRFGQCYYATCNPGFIKAWHYHKVHTDILYCIHGKTKVCLYDKRQDSPTYKQVNKFIMDKDNRIAVRVPPGVLHGQMCLGKKPSILLNVQSHVYDPGDEFKIDPFDERFGGNKIWIAE